MYELVLFVLRIPLNWVPGIAKNFNATGDHVHLVSSLVFRVIQFVVEVQQGVSVDRIQLVDDSNLCGWIRFEIEIVRKRNGDTD